MKTSAVVTSKRRSMLPAPKSSGAGASVGASKSSEILTGKKKETASALISDAQPTIPGDIDNKSEGKLAGSLANIMPGKCHIESRQTQLRRPSNLQQPAIDRKRPSSASSILNRAGQELSSSVSKTLRDPGNSVKPGTVEGAAVSANNVDNQNSEKRHIGNRVFRGIISKSASHSTSTGVNPRMLARSVDATAKKLKIPTNRVVDGAAVVQSSLQETVSKIGSSCSRSETLLNTEPVLTRLTAADQVREDAVAFVLTECASSDIVECKSDTTVEQEFDYLESSSGSAAVPDVLSQVTNDDSERLASSSGSLGILDDADLLDTSLLSFDCNSAASTARVNEVADRYDQTESPPDENTLCFKQSPSTTSEVDLPVQSSTDEASMPSPSLRPLSLMSNSSADTAIVADCLSLASKPHCQQERPSSYMSTSSADTGWYWFDCTCI